MVEIYTKYRAEYQRVRKLCDMGQMLIIICTILDKDEAEEIKKHYEAGTESDIRWLRVWLKQRAVTNEKKRT